MKREEKVPCRAALIDLPEGWQQMLQQIFNQFRIKTVAVDASKLAVDEQKYDACVVELDPQGEIVLEKVRNSPLNRHMVIYGVQTQATEFRRFSRFGMNAVLTAPLDRQAVMKTVRATHLLVLHEYRRYARIPVLTEVQISHNGARVIGTTVEVSGGGMSLTSDRRLKLGDGVELTLSLPQTEKISVRATVSWLEGEDNSIGLRFDADDERRRKIKQWVEDYLGIG